MEDHLVIGAAERRVQGVKFEPKQVVLQCRCPSQVEHVLAVQLTPILPYYSQSSPLTSQLFFLAR